MSDIDALYQAVSNVDMHTVWRLVLGLFIALCVSVALAVDRD